VVTAIIVRVVDAVVGIRVVTEEEREGLDIVEFRERAYNM
jgi:ammonium transporter, Amt family